MNFDEIVVKESPGLCRCCLSEGCYKDLGTEYLWMNDTEVYADMLLDCFDIGITQHMDGPNGAKRLICEVCITRLRDACNFKKQVLDSEKRFIDMLGRGEFRPKVLIYQQSRDLKAENVEEPAEGLELTEDAEYLEELEYFGDEEVIKTEDLQSTSNPTTSEESRVSKPKRGRPRKEEDKPTKESKVVKKPKVSKGVTRGGQEETPRSISSSPEILLSSIKVERELTPLGTDRDPISSSTFTVNRNLATIALSPTVDRNLATPEPSTVNRPAVSPIPSVNFEYQSPGSPLNIKPNIGHSASVDRDLAPDVNIHPRKGPKRLSPKEKRNIMIKNVTQVLMKTTAMPFRWLRSSYRCFYCYDIFQEASALVAHQLTHTGEQIIHKAMKNFWEPAVYIDVSNMTCKLCPEKITDLFDMINHLVDKHDVVYNKDIGLCMIAFKLDNFNITCLVCGLSFFTFGPLLYHTNKVHKGTTDVLCDVCGQHFKHKNRLRAHKKTVHDNPGLVCTECGEQFETKTKLQTHQRHQHFVAMKYKCLVCAATFDSHYKRSRHMSSEHENRTQIKCLECPKTFVFRSMMMSHLRDTHLKVRDHVCDVCGFKAFNKNRLKNHMYKHSGEKNFKCDICEKAFTTKKIMRAHIQKLHGTMQPMTCVDVYEEQ